MVSTVARLQNPSPMVSTVAKLQAITGYKFKNAQLGWESVQAPGAITRTGETLHARTVKNPAKVGFETLPDGNRRLAVVGDTALRLALCEDWYLGEEGRGKEKISWKWRYYAELYSFIALERLSRIVSSVGTNENLNIVGRQLGLQNLINDHPGRIALRKARVEGIAPLTIASTVEAILGAIYLDGGMEPVAEVMQKWGIMAPTIRKIGRKRRRRIVGVAARRSRTLSEALQEGPIEEAKASA